MALGVTELLIAVLFPLSASGVVPSPFSRLNNSINSTRALEQVLTEIVEGPLAGKWIFLVADPSAEDFFPLDKIMRSFLDLDPSPALTIACPESDWDTYLPVSVDVGGRFAVILITGTKPEWLFDLSEFWAPSTLLIFNVNASYDARSLLESPLIQRAVNLALVEVSEESAATEFFVYTSLPFSRDKDDRRLVKHFIGAWNKSLFSLPSSLFPERFQTFAGEILHVASDLDDYPLIYNDSFIDGTNIRILEALGTWLNFSFTTTKVAADLKWGSLENDTWNGLLGEVYRGEKNITVNYFTVVYDRAQDFDYTASYFTEGFGFALRIPPPLPAWRNLFFPFTPLLWASVVGAVLLTTPVIYLSVRATHTAEDAAFTDVALLVFMGLVQQSSAVVSRKGAVRLLLGTWWVGGLVLALSYTCNLIAVLTVPVFPSTISTIQQLAESNFRVSMVDYGEFVPEALATSGDHYLRALGDRMDLVANNITDELSYENLLKLLLEGQHAITETYSYLRNMIAEEESVNRHSYMLREQIYTGALAFFLPKHTAWKPRFDRGIRRLVEAGLVDKWYRDIMGDGDQHIRQETAGEKPLTLSNLQGPFLALALGLAMASLVFLLELCFNAQTKE